MSITGWEPWKHRLSAFSQRIAANPFLDEYIAQRYPLELAMERLHHRLRRGEKIRLPTTYADTVLFSLIAMVARVHARLSAQGQKRLAGMLRSALDTEAGLVPLEHEMTVAAHLMGRGFDVTFSDIEMGGGFDFLAERDDAALEIECKSVSGDLGRKIHLRRLYELGGQARPLMDAALTKRSGGQLARIVLPGRLHGTDEQLKAICERLGQTLETGKSIAGPEPCAVEYQRFSLTGSLFEKSRPTDIGLEAAREFIETIAGGGPLENAVMVFRPRSGVVMVAVESLQKDAVVRGLVRQLKESVKGQFSGTRPGVVCVKFVDITQQQLLEIAAQDNTEQPTPLKLATSYLLNRGDWAPIHTLAYLTPGHGFASRRVTGEVATHSVQERGHTYAFTNPAHPVAGDPRFSIFAD